MRVITAIELAGNYPENILITSAKQKNEKFAAFCYLTRNGDIHKIMLSTEGVFETKEEAEQYFHDLAKKCKEKYD